ncbi:MAG: NADP-dependent oxidoreductase [Betaproteobacteria bacterium]|nr:NADP-dependent oxidoreductase [Betaproteobacteria bacterium]
MSKNMQVLLASRPKAAVTEANFQIVERELPVPGPGEILVRNHWLSLDPYMRGRMNASKSYAAAVEIGDVMTGGTVGEVLESNHPRVKAGDFVVGNTGWQLYAAVAGESVTRVDPQLVPLSAYLGVVGMPGATAWIGLFEHCEPIAGETVLVSAASGAVGSVVGQLAKMQGCRTVGIAGGRMKCEYVVKELGFDACIDYKAGRLYEDLRAACPAGVDCYFENVGGPTMDTVFRVLNPFSRIALCGMISDYNLEEAYGVKLMRSLLVNRVRLQGFIVSDRMDLYQRAIARLGALVSQGRIKYRESVAEGLQNAPTAFIGLLAGRNFGKQLVKLV